MKFPLAIAALAFATAGLAGPASAATAEELIGAGKCNKCHTAATTKKGPSFASVAAKYKGKPDPTPAIVELLKTGGADDHQKVTASDAELKAIAAFVLSSK